MAANPRNSKMRRSAAAATRGRPYSKTGGAAGKRVTKRLSKASPPANPLETTKTRKPGRSRSAPGRVASAPRRTGYRDAALTAQLKAISIDLQAINSLRDEVHKLRVNIKTLTERVDTLLKARGEDIAHRSKKSELTADPKNFLDTEVVESESGLTSDALEVPEPARLEVTSSASDH